MSELSRAFPISDCETVLKRIKDVMGARVVSGETGSIEEIHILASSGRAVKYIIRDVESAIMVAFGVALDRRKISVAQIGEGAVPHVQNRVQIVKIEIVSQPDGAEVVVHLKLADTEARGARQGAPTPRNWLKMAACATMDALSQFVGPKVCFYLQDVAITTIKELRVCLVSLAVSAAGRDEILTGSCPVSLDDREAVVKATLDALNRRFSQLLEGDF